MVTHRLHLVGLPVKETRIMVHEADESDLGIGFCDSHMPVSILQSQ